jgi:hypothetical protein
MMRCLVCNAHVVAGTILIEPDYKKAFAAAFVKRYKQLHTHRGDDVEQADTIVSMSVQVGCDNDVL